MLHSLRRASILALLLSAWHLTAAAQETAMTLRPRPLPADVTPPMSLSACGGWTGFYGPIDYRTAAVATRRRVESYHFDNYLKLFFDWTPAKLLNQSIAQNFSHTRRALPNHPTTLSVMEQIGRRLGTDAIHGSDYPLECWHVRALQTVPNDSMVRPQYGIYLAFRSRPEEARRNLDLGDRGLCWSRTMQYQIGLANHKLGAFDLAEQRAAGERMGFTLPQLKRLLAKSGHWNDAKALADKDTLDCDFSFGHEAGDNKK